jgi:hypothetical protein
MSLSSSRFDADRGLPGGTRDDGRGRGQGCGGCVVAVIILAAIAWIGLSQIRIGDGPSGTPAPLTIASRWAGQEVVLTPAQPTAVVRVTFTYAGGLGHDLRPAAEITAPRNAATAQGSRPTPDPRFALVDPAVRVELLGQSGLYGNCAAPCERILEAADCTRSCNLVVDFKLTLTEAAGHDAIALTVRAGMNGEFGSPLPAGFDVRLALVPQLSEPTAGLSP